MERQITLTLDKARSMYGKSNEMDELLLANFSKDELTKKALPKSWSELKAIEGYYVSNRSRISFIKSLPINNFNEAKNIFYSEKQAKSALAMAQLSQLMAIYNDGWEAKWDGVEICYCIISFKNVLRPEIYTSQRQFLAFKSSKLRDEFLANFEPLIKEYFMID